MKRDFSKLPEADVLLDTIEDRFRKGLGSNIFIIGLSGTGKSSTGIRLSELMQKRRTEDSTMNPEIFIVDSPLDFLRAVIKSKEGDIIMVEEVSTLFPSRRAMARDNVDIGKVFDTVRKKRLLIISNAPIWGSIDSHMRAMGHFLIETLRINKTQKVVVSKFHRLQTNPSSGKTYRHTMQRGGRDVARMYTNMPSLKLWEAYEKQKDKFMMELYERLESEQVKKAEKFKKDLQHAKPQIRDLTERELQVHQLCNKEGLTQLACAERLGITQTRIHAILKNIIKKSGITKESSHNNPIEGIKGAIK